MKLWRIAADTRDYAADDLSGLGSAKYPGRWNKNGEPVVYCAPSISLATLETAAHINSWGLPLNKFLIEIDVPDGVWASRQQINLSSLPTTWTAVPAGRATVDVGSQWLASLGSLILLVPSVIVPEEFAALLNPKHGDLAKLSAKIVRQFEYSRLFRL